MSNVPYASKFLGRKTPPQRFLPFVIGGVMLGVALAAFISFGTPALYPIHVGGQSLSPLPPTAIMFFELVALCTMVVSFIGFILQNRFPILGQQKYDERITDGYLGVQVVAQESQVDQIVKAFLRRITPASSNVMMPPLPAETPPLYAVLGRAWYWWVVALVIPLLLTYDVVRVPWIDTMKDTVSVGAQQGPRRAAPAEAIPIQGPVLIAGRPASAPLPATDASLERGKILYGINCAMCHGLQGDLQGAEVGKYFPEIPALISDRVQNLPDEDIFLTVTNGLNRMPSLAENLTPGDTWDIINYVRSLAGE
jgi:mono/diheme cytochrome c family protein